MDILSDLLSMKRLYKIAFLVLSLLCVFIIPAMASDTDAFEEAINIIKAVDNDIVISEKLDEQPTRGEFIKLFARMASKDIFMTSEPCFADTASDSELNNAAYTALVLGAISKSENFEPDAAVTYAQAMKMAVCATGWQSTLGNITAENWENKYITAATSIDISKNISAGFTRRDMYVLMHNMLTCDVLLVYSGDVYQKVEDETLLSKIHGIFYNEGIVNSNGITSLYDSTESLEGNITIGDTQYINPLGYDFLGSYVRVYFTEADDEKTAVSVIPKRTQKVHLDYAQFMSETTIEGSVDEEDEKYYISKAAIYIVNGKRSTRRDFSEYYYSPDMSIELINNNGGKEYEIVNIRIAKYTIVSNVNLSGKVIYDKNGPDYCVDLSHEEAYNQFFEYSAAGNTPIDFYDIKAGDYLMVYQSEDKQYAEIYRFSKVVEGMVEVRQTLRAKEAVIGDAHYKYSLYAMDKNFDEIIGGPVVAVISPNNTLVYLTKEAGEYRYAWVMRAIYDDDIFSGKVALRVFDQSGKEEIFYLAEKVKLDGVPTKSDRSLQATLQALTTTDDAMIRYKLNANGEAIVIDTPVDYAGEQPLIEKENQDDKFTCYYRNVYAMYRYRALMFHPYFGIAPDAITFAVPKNPEQRTDADNFYIIDYVNPYTSFGYNSNYYITGYELDSSGLSKISVYFSEDKKSIRAENCAVVSDVGIALNSEEVACNYVTVYEQKTNEYVTYYSNEDTQAIAETLCPGDIISYNYEGDTMVKIEKHYSMQDDAFVETQSLSFISGYLYSFSNRMMYLLNKDALHKENITFDDLTLGDVTSNQITFIDVHRKDDGTVRVMPRYKPITEVKTYLSAGTNADYVVAGSQYSENYQMFIYNFE